jgi:2-polyprenyl-6-methoxyphenol hydroxylase-like FAD-dependent oxidoreductase
MSIRASSPLSGGVSVRNIELPRGALTSLLYELTRDKAIHHRFSDSIAALEDDSDGVSVRFKSGEHGRFDIVIGADGLHSNTRAWCSGARSRSPVILAVASTSSPCPTTPAFRMNASSTPNRAVWRGYTHGRRQ